MQEKRKKLLILGIGNFILGDEGIGVHAVRELEKCQFSSCIDIVDGGTAGLTLMEMMQSYEKVLVIDAGIDDNPEGTIRHIKPKYSEDYPPLITIHEIGLKDVIDAMQLTGYCPEIEMVVVSVKKFDSVSLDLSPQIKEKLPDVVNMVKSLSNIEDI